jgi:hypothetical protein
MRSHVITTEMLIRGGNSFAGILWDFAEIKRDIIAELKRGVAISKRDFAELKMDNAQMTTASMQPG